MKSVYLTYKACLLNERIIEQARDSGLAAATISTIYLLNDYSPLSGLKYIDINDPDSWPNHSMELYYGIDKIYGAE